MVEKDLDTRGPFVKKGDVVSDREIFDAEMDPAKEYSFDTALSTLYSKIISFVLYIDILFFTCSIFLSVSSIIDIVLSSSSLLSVFLLLISSYDFKFNSSSFLASCFIFTFIFSLCFL